jgi:hypothetical protein
MSNLNDRNPKDLEAFAYAAMLDFCKGYHWMFEKQFHCSRAGAERMDGSQLQHDFGGIIAVNNIAYAGAGTGTFMILFDKAALFSLGGVTVMLPLSRLKEDCIRGKEQDAVALSDAVGEVGNLLVGSFNKILRDGCPGVDGLGGDVTLRLRLPVSVGKTGLHLDPGVPAYHVFTYRLQMTGLDPFCLKVAFPATSA